MTDLKTLKDFEKHVIGYKRDIEFQETYLYNTLRQEAIKWVKENRENGWDMDEWNFIEFFNLTEEELK